MTKPVAKKAMLVDLKVELTNDEKRLRGEELAKILDQVDALDVEWDKKKDEIKDQKEPLEERMQVLRAAIRSGQEQRAVDCEEEVDAKNGKFILRRKDTGEVVSERMMSKEERDDWMQAKLFKGPKLLGDGQRPSDGEIVDDGEGDDKKAPGA